MAEERPEHTRRCRGTVKTFLEGVSLEEANFLIGRIDRAIEGEDLCGPDECPCNVVHCKMAGCVVLPRILSSYRQVRTRSVLSRLS